MAKQEPRTSAAVSAIARANNAAQLANRTLSGMSLVLLAALVGGVVGVERWRGGGTSSNGRGKTPSCVGEERGGR